MSKSIKIIILISILLFSAITMCSIFSRIFKTTSQLTVNFNSPEGEITYGGTGFLYGIAEPNVPNGNILKGLKPKVLATRVPKGLQHPSGDISQVEATFFENGGESAVIYMQDIYPEWYYGYRPDYIETMATVLDDLIACTYSDKFIYQPFNEMDNGVWYGDFSKKENRIKFYEIFEEAYKLIKQKTGGSQVAGPSYCNYNREYIKEFLEYCIEHECVPEVMVWHELSWYSTYGLRDTVDDYRKLERSLGLSERRIILDEYGSMKDIGIPGKMMQYIASFEAKKVDGCLAFWRIPNNLNELAIDNNVPTSMWWLYHWYGRLSGYTYKTTKSNNTRDYLSAIAAHDEDKMTVLFAGSEGKTQINLTNLQALKQFKQASALSYTIEYLDFQGLHAACYSSTEHMRGVTNIINGNAKIILPDAKYSRAYRLILSPVNKKVDPYQEIIDPSTRYEAENCNVKKKQIVKYDQIQYASSGDGVKLKAGESIKFEITSPKNSLYELNFVYACNHVSNGERINSKALISIDGELENHVLPNTLQIGATTAYKINKQLTAGSHTIELTSVDAEMVVDFLDIKVVENSNNSYQSIYLNNNNEGNQYLVVVPQSGYYKVDNDVMINSLNDIPIQATKGQKLYLQYGINVFKTNVSNQTITFSFIQEKAKSISIQQANLNGAITQENEHSPTGSYLKDAQINVPIEFIYTTQQRGLYGITIQYAQPEVNGRHDYNVKLVERYAVINVNGNQSTHYFANTYSNDSFSELTIYVELLEGENNITFINNGHYKWGDLLPKLPNISGISINKATE